MRWRVFFFSRAVGSSAVCSLPWNSELAARRCDRRLEPRASVLSLASTGFGCIFAEFGTFEDVPMSQESIDPLCSRFWPEEEEEEAEDEEEEGGGVGMASNKQITANFICML